MKPIPYISTHFISHERCVDVTPGRIYRIEEWYGEGGCFLFQDDAKDPRDWSILAWDLEDVSFEANLKSILE